MIPRFSLDRGFEFAYSVKFGERQCLLQSTLIAALLQSMGIKSGVFMVWSNEKGQKSNNGHAVAVIKLSDGRDVLVDASHHDPFVRYQGVFVLDRSADAYRFVQPIYDRDAYVIGYRRTVDGRIRSPTQALALGTGFLTSQFYYYRGERAAGGLLGRPATRQGLAASARMLRLAEEAAPQNPLPVYVLGHVYQKLGMVREAAEQYAKGYQLYTAFGFVPDGPREAYTRTKIRFR